MAGSRERSIGLAHVLALASLLPMTAALCAPARAQAVITALNAAGNEALPSAPLPVGTAAGGENAAIANANLGNGIVQGVAAGNDGEVYEGVSVVLTGMGANSGRALTQTTDADGTFRFTNVGAGRFRLTLTSPGFVTQTVTGTLHAGETYDVQKVTLAMAGATSDVQVTASQAEIAQAQVKIEETQRVLGVVPNFYVAYDHNAAPMTTRQKWQMMWRTDVDPFTWLSSGAIAGFEQADNILPGYGQGAAGYAKRFGASYGGTLTNTAIGGAILPTLLKQDPRYFYKGTGTVSSRIWYAIATAVICKGDNGKWQPNYSGIVGGLASGALENLYYPKSDIGWGITFEGAALGTAEGAVQSLFQEFVVKKLTPGFRHSGN